MYRRTDNTLLCADSMPDTYREGYGTALRRQLSRTREETRHCSAQTAIPHPRDLRHCSAQTALPHPRPSRHCSAQTALPLPETLRHCSAQTGYRHAGWCISRPAHHACRPASLPAPYCRHPGYTAVHGPAGDHAVHDERNGRDGRFMPDTALREGLSCTFMHRF